MKLLPIAAALLAAGLLTSCAATGESNPPLRVGSDLDNKPFAWVDESGEAAGRDVQMMQELAQRMGREIEWVPMPFDELLGAVRAGRVDIVCATLGITPERAVDVDFSSPYFRTELVAVTRAAKGSPASISELTGKAVAAGAGTTSARAVAMRAPAAKLSPGTKDGATSRERLATGEVAAVVMDGPAAEAMIKASAGAFTRLPESFGPESYALALPKGSPLRAALDQALASMERDGSLARLDERHGLRQIGAAPPR